MKFRLLLVLVILLISSCTASNQPIEQVNPGQNITESSQAISTSFPTSQQSESPENYPPTLIPDESSVSLVDTAQPILSETEDPLLSMRDECLSHESSQNIDLAIGCWDGVLIQQPEDYEALNKLANLYGAYKGDWARGVEYGRLAAAVAPTIRDKVDTLINLALGYESLSDYQASIAVFNQVLEIGDSKDPTIIMAYLHIANSFKENNQMAEACEYFRKGIEFGTQIGDNSIMNLRGQERFYCP